MAHWVYFEFEVGWGKIAKRRWGNVPGLLLVQATSAIGDLLAGAGVHLMAGLLGDEIESWVEKEVISLGSLISVESFSFNTVDAANTTFSSFGHRKFRARREEIWMEGGRTLITIVLSSSSRCTSLSGWGSSTTLSLFSGSTSRGLVLVEHICAFLEEIHFDDCVLVCCLVGEVGIVREMCNGVDGEQEGKQSLSGSRGFKYQGF